MYHRRCTLLWDKVLQGDTPKQQGLRFQLANTDRKSIVNQPEGNAITDGLFPVTLDCSCQLIASDSRRSLRLTPASSSRGDSSSRLSSVPLVCYEAHIPEFTICDKWPMRIAQGIS